MYLVFDYIIRLNPNFSLDPIAEAMTKTLNFCGLKNQIHPLPGSSPRVFFQ